MRTLVILPSARKRGYTDDDLLHAVANAVRIYQQDDGMAMHIGPDQAGRMMEVGTIVLRDGQTAIAHSMRPARPKYTRR
ncbi:MAG: hypothetical protein LBV00_08110 [Propionibacteriaceae bacterium]|nr:hypothetical protein [Propionibacteriaceae bacterium]